MGESYGMSRWKSGVLRTPIRSLAFTLYLTLFVVGASSTETREPAQSAVYSTDKQDLQLIEALNAIIPKVMMRYNVPGLNIALAHGGRLAWEGAYGFADVKLRRPMTSETVFHSGSLAKVYAGIAIMQLVEEGHLKLNESINRYLPFEISNPLGGPPITVRHLLTHTSGLGNSATDAMSYLCDGSHIALPLEERLRSVFKTDSTDPSRAISIWTQPTGTQWQYSNLGAATLGLIVERVNAEHLTYSEYVQRHIMDPLGMRYAQIPVAQIRELTRADIWERLSVGYQTMGNAWIRSAQVCFGSFPCGGSFATPTDYLRLLMAMMQGGSLNGVQLLTKDSAAQMLTPATFLGEKALSRYPTVTIPQDDDGPREDQGLIWQLRDWNAATRAYHHGGGHMYGWRTMAMAFPYADIAFVVAVNRWNSLNDSQPEIDSVSSFIESWLKAQATGESHQSVRTVVNSLRPQATTIPTISNVSWKASYLRGLLFAESYKLGIRTPQRLTDKAARIIADDSAPALVSAKAALWDPNGFVAGVTDMAALEATPEAVHLFATTHQMKISLAEARQLYLLFDPNGGSDATLAGLLSIKPGAR